MTTRMDESQSLLQRLEKFAYDNRKVLTISLFGLLFLGIGAFLFRSGVLDSTKVEVLGQQTGTASAGTSSKVTAEIAGSVLKPGVYELSFGDRVDSLLTAAGGLAAGADRAWVEKNINRAAKVMDGQKIYIPRTGEQTDYRLRTTAGGSVDSSLSTVDGRLNINSASLKELDSLPGIGAVRAQSIIDHRPYASIEELVSKKVLPQSVYDKIKDAIVAP